jgi:hypothetical protein
VVKGTLRFTTSGRPFEELPSGVSVASTFKQDDVVVVDRDGRLQDFDAREWREYHQDPAAILHVKRWELLEVSLTDRPADRGAIARPINAEARRIRRRMQAQQRSLDRDDDDDGLLLREIMPSSRQILHESPELIQARQAEDRRLICYGD